MDRRPTTASVRPLVLILPAQEETGALYAISLSATGFHVIAARNGAEAYRRARELHPDVIVIELPMRNNDGSQLLQDLKETGATRHIPILAVSADVQQPVSERADRSGSGTFFANPCLPHELAAGIREVLDGNTPASGTP
jgi:CheY-like chemotaxis protein